MPGNALTDSTISARPALPAARWLPPGAWPDESQWLFQPGPVATGREPVAVTRYADVVEALRAPDVWRRAVPSTVATASGRHCTFSAAWSSDGDTHKLLRRSMRQISRGSGKAAREYTVRQARRLLAELMREPPPWDLARVIYHVSMRLAVEHTLSAPPLHEHIGSLQRFVRAQVTASGGVQGISRQPEFEDILVSLASRAADLPPGLARDLAGMYLAGTLSRPQLAGQLGLVLASSETQATVAASLIAMLLDSGDWEYARQAIGHPELARRLIAEGARRGIAFPAAYVTAAVPALLGGQDIPAGTPVALSFAAANLDPARFGPDGQRFDPRPARPAHITFGLGARRCLGAAGVGQFGHDIVSAILAALPGTPQLHGGRVLRETAGLTWVIAQLPVSPG